MMVVLAEYQRMLHRILDKSEWVCKRRNLRYNADKSKVIVYEKAREHTTYFGKFVWAEITIECMIRLRRGWWMGRNISKYRWFYVSKGALRERGEGQADR